MAFQDEKDNFSALGAANIEQVNEFATQKPTDQF